MTNLWVDEIKAIEDHHSLADAAGQAMDMGTGCEDAHVKIMDKFEDAAYGYIPSLIAALRTRDKEVDRLKEREKELEYGLAEAVAIGQALLDRVEVNGG